MRELSQIAIGIIAFVCLGVGCRTYDSAQYEKAIFWVLVAIFFLVLVVVEKQLND